MEKRISNAKRYVEDVADTIARYIDNKDNYPHNASTACALRDRDRRSAVYERLRYLRSSPFHQKEDKWGGASRPSQYRTVGPQILRLILSMILGRRTGTEVCTLLFLSAARYCLAFRRMVGNAAGLGFYKVRPCHSQNVGLT